jgi:hypothetical protein
LKRAHDHGAPDDAFDRFAFDALDPVGQRLLAFGSDLACLLACNLSHVGAHCGGDDHETDGEPEGGTHKKHCVSIHKVFDEIADRNEIKPARVKAFCSIFRDFESNFI